MDATGLKAMQAPLKEAYRDEASRALITLRAKGSIDDQS
ncbi:MAG: OsmC family peroxiredoxin, partial [Mesorhizobium sp.]